METTTEIINQIEQTAEKIFDKLNPEKSIYTAAPSLRKEYLLMAIEILKIQKLSILDDMDTRLNILNHIDNTLQETKYKLQDIATQIQFTY